MLYQTTLRLYEIDRDVHEYLSSLPRGKKINSEIIALLRRAINDRRETGTRTLTTDDLDAIEAIIEAVLSRYQFAPGERAAAENSVIDAILDNFLGEE